MAGYLDQYGAGEERRNRIIIRSILGVLIAAVVYALGWYLLLNHHQEGVVKDFLAALKRGALVLPRLGLHVLRPCPDYTYENS